MEVRGSELVWGPEAPAQMRVFFYFLFCFEEKATKSQGLLISVKDLQIHLFRCLLLSLFV